MKNALRAEIPLIHVNVLAKCLDKPLENRKCTYCRCPDFREVISINDYPAKLAICLECKRLYDLM